VVRAERKHQAGNTASILLPILPHERKVDSNEWNADELHILAAGIHCGHSAVHRLLPSVYEARLGPHHLPIVHQQHGFLQNILPLLHILSGPHLLDCSLFDIPAYYLQ